jgi:SpoU rRNA methylase family enzyme
MPQPHAPSPRYPTFDELRLRHPAEQREAAIQAFRNAEKIALEAGGKLVVFGSLADAGFVLIITPEGFLFPALRDRIKKQGREPCALD